MLVEYDTDGKQRRVIPLVEPDRHTVRLGEHLWITLVAARPQVGVSRDTIIGYIWRLHTN